MFFDSCQEIWAVACFDEKGRNSIAIKENFSHLKMSVLKDLFVNIYLN
jgi:hypothetical protein